MDLEETTVGLGWHRVAWQKEPLLSWVAVAHSFNPSTQKAEIGGSLRVPDQPGLHNELQNNPGLYTKTLSQKNK